MSRLALLEVCVEVGKKLPVRQVSEADAASAILLSSPGTCPMEARMCCRLSAKEISHRIGPTEEAVLTLPLLDHPCDTVLLTYV